MSNFLLLERRTLTLVPAPGARHASYSLEAVASLADVHPELLRYYCRRGLLGASYARTEADPVFDDDGLYELRRIEHYRRRYGVSRRALPLLCGLWREIGRLQGEVRFLRGP